MFHIKFLQYALFWLTVFWLICFTVFAFSTAAKNALRGYGIIAMSYLAVMIMSVLAYYFL